MRGSVVGIALTGAVALGFAALLPIVAASRPAGNADPGQREVRLVARDMAFFVEGDEAANPTLRFRAGEKIRIVLRNEDPGMKHDFSITAWKVATRTLAGKGAEAAVVFRVPDRQGTIPYQCTPHSQMMRGTIQVD